MDIPNKLPADVDIKNFHMTIKMNKAFGQYL